MRNRKLLWCSLVVMAITAFYFSGMADSRVNARKGVETNTPQPLPFNQNWANAALITANDDWSGVPGIVGFLGNYDTVNAPTNVDPRTLLTPFVTNDPDVIANQNSVALTNGGVAEFDGIANPVVALNGSGTADAPHIIIYVNTTGATSINFACNIRDIDDTIDNSAQQVDVQYRVGGTGNYTSVTGGYIADASSGPSTTMTTPLNLALPAAVDNQAMVEIRVMTTNAGSNDEWIGVDDISVTGTVAPVNQQHVIDLDGDGKTDFVITRNTGAGPNGQLTWMGLQNGGGAETYVPFGLDSDFEVPEDYDGDNKTDIAVWRSGGPGGPGGSWYILQSQTATVRAENYGIFGDDPNVAGDYDGDGKADLAVYRAGATAGSPSFWFYRTTANGPVFARQWGQFGDGPAPGDYDGDGKDDFVVRRNAGLQGVFFFNYGADLPGVASRIAYFGLPSNKIVTGDFDGDGKSDLAVLQAAGSNISWVYEPSSAPGGFTTILWGFGPTDLPAPGDYDGDGKTDPAVFRSDPNPDMNFFFARKSSDGSLLAQEWGQEFDIPVAFLDTH